MTGLGRLAFAPLVLAVAACAAPGKDDIRIVRAVPAQPIHLASGGDAVAMEPTQPLSIAVRVSGEAYQAPPAFDLYLGDRLVGRESVDWARPTEEMGQSKAFRDGIRVGSADGLEWRQVEYRVPDVSRPVGPLRIVYANNNIEADGDLPRHIDRNLIVDWVEIDGVRLQAEDERVVYRRGNTLVSPREKMSWNGDLIFDLTEWSELAHLAEPAPDSRTIAQAGAVLPSDSLE